LVRLTVNNLSKNFGYVRAIDNVSFTLGAGQVLVLAGANGAGKTTLLNCIAGLCRPEEGTIEKKDVAGVGYLAEKSFLYNDLSVRDNLVFWARFLAVADYKTKVADLLDFAGLAGVAEAKVKNLSSGMHKRAALCRAIIAEPSVLLLDEPFTGLDGAGRELLKEIIAGYCGEGKIVIVATHNIERVLPICSHLAVLHTGRLGTFAEKTDLDLQNIESELNKTR